MELKNLLKEDFLLPEIRFDMTMFIHMISKPKEQCTKNNHFFNSHT